MKKVFCDCCERDITGNGCYTFTYFCHLDKERRIKCGYIDLEGNAVSGRQESKDLCIKCYNTITFAAVLKFENLQEQYYEELDD
jgi:hypothetical protein